MIYLILRSIKLNAVPSPLTLASSHLFCQLKVPPQAGNLRDNLHASLNLTLHSPPDTQALSIQTMKSMSNLLLSSKGQSCKKKKKNTMKPKEEYAAETVCSLQSLNYYYLALKKEFAHRYFNTLLMLSST